MKKTIAHISETYMTGDPNNLRCYAPVSDRYEMVALCEKSDGNSLKNSEKVYFYNEPWSIFSKTAITRSLYLIGRNDFYKKVLMHKKASLIHAHFGPTGAELTDLATELKLPMVVTFYGMDISRLMKRRKWIRLYQKMFKINGLFMVLCEEAKSRLEKVGCPSEKIRIADCLNDLSLYRYRSRTPGKGIKLLIAARFIEKKGYPILFKAVADLIGKGMDIRLTVLGYGSSDQKQSLVDDIKRLKIGDRVFISDTSGMNSSFTDIYRENLYSHDIFVLPSISAKDGDDEGGPSLTLIDAQASGMPVITTPFPGSERSVIDGKTGLFCRSGDPESLSGRIEYLIKDPGLWNVLGKNASDYVNKNLSLDNEIKRIVEIYEELL